MKPLNCSGFLQDLPPSDVFQFPLRVSPLSQGNPQGKGTRSSHLLKRSFLSKEKKPVFIPNKQPKHLHIDLGSSKTKLHGFLSPFKSKEQNVFRLTRVYGKSLNNLSGGASETQLRGSISKERMNSQPNQETSGFLSRKPTSHEKLNVKEEKPMRIKQKKAEKDSGKTQSVSRVSNDKSLREMEEYIEKLKTQDEVKQSEEEKMRITQKIHNRFISIGDLAGKNIKKRRLTFKDALGFEAMRQEETIKMKKEINFLNLHRQHLKERQEKARETRQKIAEELLKKEKNEILIAQNHFSALSQTNHRKVLQYKLEHLEKTKKCVDSTEEILEIQNSKMNQEIEGLLSFLDAKVKWAKKKTEEPKGVFTKEKTKSYSSGLANLKIL